MRFRPEDTEVGGSLRVTAGARPTGSGSPGFPSPHIESFSRCCALQNTICSHRPGDTPVPRTPVTSEKRGLRAAPRPLQASQRSHPHGRGPPRDTGVGVRFTTAQRERPPAAVLKIPETRSHVRPGGAASVSGARPALCPQTSPRLLSSCAKWQVGPRPRLAAPLPAPAASLARPRPDASAALPGHPATQDRPPPPELTSALCE